MKLIQSIFILGLIFFGFKQYGNYKKEKETEKSTKICKEFFKTSSSECIEEKSKYYYINKLSEKLAEQKLPDFKREVEKVDEMIKSIDLSKVNPHDYTYVSAAELDSYKFDLYRKKTSPIEGKKIFISGYINEGYGCFTLEEKQFYFCVKISDQDRESVIVSNYDEFPKIKEIIKKIKKLNIAEFYKFETYGRIEGSKNYQNIIKSDLIKLTKKLRSRWELVEVLEDSIGQELRKNYSDYLKKIENKG